MSTVTDFDLFASDVNNLTVREQDKMKGVMEHDTGFLTNPCHHGICAICMDKIVLQETALLKGCEHAYCVTCILRWASYNEHPKCPQCKNPFESLHLHRSLDGRMIPGIRGAMVARLTPGQKVACSIYVGFSKPPILLHVAATRSLFWVYQCPQQSCKPVGSADLKPTAPATPSCTRPNSFRSLRTAVALYPFPIDVTVNRNERIREFCEMGSLRDAVQTLSGPPKSELDLNSYCLVLQLCAEHRSLKGGRQVHSVISSNGLKVEDVLGAKLVFMYVSCGDLVQGRKIFDQIANEKVFLWNFLINQYSRVGDFDEGIRLYYRMREMGVEANSYTFSCVYKCFTGLGCLNEGEKAHGCLLKLGLGDYPVVANSLIAFYFRCGRVDGARKVFVELTDREVISWNSMISGYASNGYPWKGLQLFKQMLYAGFVADLATMICVLACADVGALMLAKKLHAHVIKGCFHKDLRIENTLIDMYSKCGDLESAAQVFKNMAERSVVSWTAMVAAYAREGLADDAIRLFHEMGDDGIKPDTFAITNALHACALTGFLTNGRCFDAYVRRSNMESNLSVCNALMDMYAKCGSMEEAQLVFDDMPTRDTVSWNTMIGGYSKNNSPNEALDLFLRMQHEVEPDGVTIACILSALASLGILEPGREVHAFVLRMGYLSDPFVANALIDMYVKCGAISLAQFLFNYFPSKDLVSWTIMIAGYGIHGLGEEAIETFNEMRKSRIEPNEVSFISILRACTHSGLLDEGLNLYDIMRNYYKIEPNMEHYNCMVDLLARAGQLTKAYKFIELMPTKADSSAWISLLYGCRMHHDVELAEKACEHISELEPDNLRHNVLLANVYAEAQKWTEVKKKLRDGMGHHGNKDLCSSWIEAKGRVQIFGVENAVVHQQRRRIETVSLRLIVLRHIKLKPTVLPCFNDNKHILSVLIRLQVVSK